MHIVCCENEGGREFNFVEIIYHTFCLGTVVSVLGYCLIPIVGLSGLAGTMSNNIKQKTWRIFSNQKDMKKSLK